MTMTCEAEAHFNTLSQQKGHQLVIILSDTCPDCIPVRRYLPVLEQFYPNLNIYVFNRMTLSETVVNLTIEGVPAFLLFQEGNLKARWTDRKAKPFIEVKAFIDAALKEDGET